MTPLDYSRSFITFVLAGRANCARIQVESRLVLSQPEAGQTEYWLVASCKAEQTYAPQSLFQHPNYDFCIIYTRDRYRILREPLLHDPALGESGRLLDRFESVQFGLNQATGAESLATPDAVYEATLAGRLLVAQNELAMASGATATLEYPVKTMNVRPEPQGWQIDTGPLASPPDLGWDGALETLDLAYAAFNTADWVELLRHRPHAVREQRVGFYGDGLVLTSKNRLWAL